MNATAYAAPEKEGAIDYGLRWRVQSVFPGSHRGTGSADAGVLRALVPFERAPDIRRLDLRRSMRDPFGQWYVKEYQPHVSVTIYALVDVSASMAWADGAASKLSVAAQLCDLLARAAHRNGDRFGLIACGGEIHETISVPPSRHRAGASETMMRLSTMRPTDDSAAALLSAADNLSGPRKLVFLISDFLFPDAHVEQLLSTLAVHDAIPVVLEDQSILQLPDWGITSLADLESGQQRLMILRPSLKRRWLDAVKRRRQHLDALCERFASRPFRITQALDIEAFNSYLLER